MMLIITIGMEESIIIIIIIIIVIVIIVIIIVIIIIIIVVGSRGHSNSRMAVGILPQVTMEMMRIEGTELTMLT